MGLVLWMYEHALYSSDSTFLRKEWVWILQSMYLTTISILKKKTNKDDYPRNHVIQMHGWKHIFPMVGIKTIGKKRLSRIFNTKKPATLNNKLVSMCNIPLIFLPYKLDQILYKNNRFTLLFLKK